MVQHLLPAQSPINLGDIIDKYRVERVVGVGAMGVVVAARHLTLDQVVAIKFLVEHRFGSAEESIGRFLAEARASAKIESDHVCRVSDVGMTANGVPYMIMEHLDGTDLEEEIIQRGQLEIVEAVDYVLQALDAIAAAHQLGIVHRDLKPANLFLARRPDGSRRVKVLDFGISKATGNPGGGGRRFTRETRSLGTPAYMPPEQIRDPMNVDHRADIWALGCILYELLTGQMAFVGDNIKEVLDRVLTEDPCPIPALRRDVPPDLIATVARSLSRDRDARFQSAALFARSLSFFGSIGVLSGLASIQREVGSLSSISAVRFPSGAMQSYATSSGAHAAAAPSVEPMVSNVPREMITQPDPGEISRRHVVAHDWAALQTRRRRARSAVLGMITALLFAASVMIIVRRVVRPRALGGQQPSAETRIIAATPPPAPTTAPSASVIASASSANNVHSTPSSVRSTRNGAARSPSTHKPR